ncbi:breast carcinoma-amplified sequence 1 isoform X3 [Spea bombifrons]|uniref:breast carcinoma-amplified sequence 1 isoform X3 n=1 Tax=Spea bombifrons TaxID=233779 RepID=UPI00234B8C2F|nr:breast carcinoma-amplified sequence 1 isoform X3 [Spea bombifrons]
MGNELSKTQEREDQEEGLPENDSELVVGVKNGPVTQQSPPGLNAMKSNDQVDTKIVQQENVITSSQKTIIISPISNGITNNQPSAKSKFRMTITRPAPGPAAFQANGPDIEVEKPVVTLGDQPVVQVSNDTPVVLQTNVSGIQNQPPPSTLPAEDASVTLSTQGEDTSSKPKEIKEMSLFQRLFMPEKKVQIEDTLQPETEVNKEAGITVEQNSQLQSLPQNNTPQLQNTDGSKQASVQVLNAGAVTLSTTTTDTKATQTRSEATQTTPTEEVHPVMSFFKTLVSPNKPATKSEDEIKNEADEKKKENGGLRKSPIKKEKSKSFSEQTLDAESKGSKNAESSKTRTLSRFFKQKSKKEEQQGSENKVVEEPAVMSVSVNSEKAAAPVQILTQDPLPSDSTIQSQITAQTSKDGEKASKESAPRPRPFWRKVVQEPAVVSLSIDSEKAAAPVQVLAQDPIPSEANVPLKEEGKTAKEPTPLPKLFWRKSFKSDPPPNKVQENVVQEQNVVSVSVNAAPQPVLKEAPNPKEQTQTSIQPTNDEVKNAKEPTPRPLPFWRKSFKGDPPSVKIQENSVNGDLQVIQPTGNVAEEQAVVSVSVNSQKSAPEQELAQDTTPNSTQSSKDDGKTTKESSSRPITFWRKSFKGDPSPVKIQENVAQEQAAVSVSVNVEKSAPEPILIQETTPNLQSQNTGNISKDEGKPINESSPGPVPFWRKPLSHQKGTEKSWKSLKEQRFFLLWSLLFWSFKADPQSIKIKENSLKEDPQVIQLTVNASSKPEAKANTDAAAAAGTGPKGQETQDKQKKPEDGKNAKPKLMMFFKQLSVIGDGGNTNSEETNQQKASPPTLDISDGVEVSKNEKTVVSAVVETPAQKSKENSKDKKTIAEKATKQEIKECPEATSSSVQQQVPEPAVAQNGGDSESQMKRTEKRQSLGSFFKAIGPKRMCDAEVQTDPVSILPAEKVK